jgi:hypothetical protein
MSSNASIFAERGNPWVSDREGREKYGRNVEKENPDYDAQLFAKKATKEGPPAVVKRKKEVPKEDGLRRRAAIAIKLNNELKK